MASSLAEEEQVLVEEKLYARTLVLNRPRQLNALSFQMISRMLELFVAYEEDSNVKLVIVKISILNGTVFGGGAGASIHGRFRVATENSQNGNVISFGSHTFDLYSAGLFALFSMIVASARLQPVEFGISSFLLELTMDASIEIFWNDHRPQFGYLLGASFYCVILIFMRSYHDSIENADYELCLPRYQEASDLEAPLENTLLAPLYQEASDHEAPMENTLPAPLYQMNDLRLTLLALLTEFTSEIKCFMGVSVPRDVHKSLLRPIKIDRFRGKHLMGKKSLGKNIWNSRAFDGKRKGR